MTGDILFHFPSSFLNLPKHGKIIFISIILYKANIRFYLPTAACLR